MNDSGPRMPDDASAGGSPRTPGREPGDGTPPHAFLGDTRGDVVCGVCRVTLKLVHRTVRVPCGQGRHGWLSSTLVVWLRPSRESRHQHHSAARSQLRSPAAETGRTGGSGQADPGLRYGAARMARRTAGDDDLRSQGLSYGWDQNSGV